MDRAKLEKLLDRLAHVRSQAEWENTVTALLHELPALLRLARAVADAPRGVVIAVTASDTIGNLETVVESGRSFPNGQTVILLRADAADTTGDDR